jgi:multidrug resistance efflux pump
MFKEVLAHGTYVNEGDVIAQFRYDVLSEQITDAELALRSAALLHAGKEERARMSAEKAQEALADKRLAGERAKRLLDGWEKYELDFQARSRELQEQFGQQGIDDQVDELSQLEAMYRDDELVEATEEIVLKRARRRLATTRVSLKLASERRLFEAIYEIAPKTALKREAVAREEAELARLVRTQELDAESTADGLTRSEAQLAKVEKKRIDLQRDLAAMVLRAPRAGVLLHGGEASARPGAVRPDYQPGGRASSKTPLFAVADPDRLALSCSVPESMLDRVRTGVVVKVYPTAVSDKTLVGTLSLATYPIPKSAAGKEAQFEGRISLAGRQAGIVAGMRARLEVTTEQLKEIILIPRTAVFGTGAEAHCWVSTAEGQPFQRATLALGPVKAEEVVVLGGLEAGQRVLLAEPRD